MDTSYIDDRYGRSSTRKRTSMIVGAVTAAVVLIGAVLLWWSIQAASSGSPSFLTSGFNIVDSTSVDITYQVTIPQGESAQCALQALNEEMGTVGWKYVDLPASDTLTRHISDSIETVEMAVTGLVYGCWIN